MSASINIYSESFFYVDHELSQEEFYSDENL